MTSLTARRNSSFPARDVTPPRRGCPRASRPLRGPELEPALLHYYYLLMLYILLYKI